MDKMSLLGYQQGSPYRGRKSITINTPEGLIDMSNTDIPLLAKDNTGMAKLLQPFSGMHKFRGNKVTEYRMQDGGEYEEDDSFDFLFEERANQQEPTIPGESDLEESVVDDKINKRILEEQQYNEAMAIYYRPFYRRNSGTYSGNGIVSPPLNLGMGKTNVSNYRGSAGKYGETFQTFGSYQEGRSALENQLRLYQTGKTRNPVKPTSSIYEAMSVYAPASDNNNPKKYAEFIANKLGVSPTTPISQIDTKKWADAIEIMEGNKGRGNNPGNLKRIK